MIKYFENLINKLLYFLLKLIEKVHVYSILFLKNKKNNKLKKTSSRPRSPDER
jgi:hypothetical protein